MGRLALRMRSLSFSYGAGGGEIGPLDWEVEEGAFVLLVGGTGSGKTTLLRHCKPELAPAGTRSGEVEVFGRPVAEMDAATSAHSVGYVAQSPENQLVCDTVWHQLAFGLENLGTPVAQMRRRVAEVAHFFGLEPLLNRDVNELSGGQKQLVNLASILATQPRLLLLDEPGAQLDPVAEKNFAHALFRLNRELGLTLVVATHAPEALASYATSCVEIRAGRVAPLDLGVFLPGEEGLPVAGPGEDVCAPASGPRGGGFGSETPAVRMSDVYLRYGRGAPWVLSGLDLGVAAGSVHVLLGGNGCGKSTLLGAAAGVRRPERGRVEVACRDSVALLPQDPKALFVCDTVADELREWQQACGYSAGEVGAALDRMGLPSCRDRHPYDLSGGQQQLLALAKLLLTQPALLLLDEPTKGLDAACKRTVAELVAACRSRGTTVLAATHDLTFAAAVADRVSLVFDGKITCTETPSEFFDGNFFYRLQPDAFWRSWTGGAGR